VSVRDGGAAVEADGDVVYRALSLRNVGSGIAVLQAWQAQDGMLSAVAPPAAVDEFRSLTRDDYLAGGNVGSGGELCETPTIRCTRSSPWPHAFSVELLYTDQVGEQRTVSGFAVLSADAGGWISAVGRHRYLDAAAPR
jgi:hypothetical protein